MLFLYISGILIGQSIYSGSFDLKNQSAFNLISENEIVTVQIAKKQIDINNSEKNTYGLRKIKSNQFLFFCGSDSIQIVQAKKKLTFQPGLVFDYKKRTLKELILVDAEGKIALNAEYDFKYPVANYKINIQGNTKIKELLSYATYYLFDKSKKLKNAYETPYIYFGPY